MAPVIRISDSVYRDLESLAKGFDTPQNVIERLINDIKERQGNQMDNTITTPDDAERTTYPTTRKSNKRKKTTLEDIKEIYPIAKDVWFGKYHIDDAVDRLVTAIDMNPASATIYLLVFQQMMKGECYKRAINATATDYFLEHIHKDFGQEVLEKALSAVNQHIAHDKKLGCKPQYLIDIAEKFSQKL